jgi:hypothetical protein
MLCLGHSLCVCDPASQQHYNKPSLPALLSLKYISTHATIALPARSFSGWNPVKPIDYAVEWWSVNFEWAETAEMVSSRYTQPALAYTDFEDADLFAHQQTEGGLAKLVTCLAAKSKIDLNRRVKLNTKVRLVQNYVPSNGPSSHAGACIR